MEGCLKKLVLEAQATGFQGPKKGAGSRWDRLRENSCSEGSTGGKGVYIRYRREAKKFIPVKGSLGRFQMDNADNNNPRQLGLYNTTVPLDSAVHYTPVGKHHEPHPVVQLQ